MTKVFLNRNKKRGEAAYKKKYHHQTKLVTSAPEPATILPPKPSTVTLLHHIAIDHDEDMRYYKHIMRAEEPGTGIKVGDYDGHRRVGEALYYSAENYNDSDDEDSNRLYLFKGPPHKLLSKEKLLDKEGYRYSHLRMRDARTGNYHGGENKVYRIYEESLRVDPGVNNIPYHERGTYLMEDTNSDNEAYDPPFPSDGSSFSGLDNGGNYLLEKMQKKRLKEHVRLWRDRIRTPSDYPHSEDDENMPYE